MKKYIIKSALLATLAFATLTSCDEDTVTYGGQNFVTYENVANTRVSAFENGGIYEIPVNLAFPTSQDVTVSFEVTSDVAQAGVHYELLTQSPITIAAGETQTIIRINVIDNDILNDSKSLQVKLLEVTSDSSIAVGLADEGSYEKSVLLLNNDCTTNFFTWVGDLNWTRSGENAGSGTAIGDVNSFGDCNILKIQEGSDFAYGPSQEFPVEFTFTPGTSGPNSGTVVAGEQIWCQQCYDEGDKSYDVLFKATGSFNATTKKLIISGECFISLGSFGARQTVFEPAQ